MKEHVIDIGIGDSTFPRGPELFPNGFPHNLHTCKGMIDNTELKFKNGGSTSPVITIDKNNGKATVEFYIHFHKTPPAVNSEFRILSGERFKVVELVPITSSDVDGPSFIARLHFERNATYDELSSVV